MTAEDVANGSTHGKGLSGWCDACGRTCQAASLAVMIWVDLSPSGSTPDRVEVPDASGRLVCGTCRDHVAHLLRTLGLRSR